MISILLYFFLGVCLYKMAMSRSIQETKGWAGYGFIALIMLIVFHFLRHLFWVI